MRTGTEERRAVLAGGAALLATGASLVVHVVAGTPLPATLGVLVLAGGAVVAGVVRRDPARSLWLGRLRAGVVAGLAATAVYDAARWLLVQVGGFQQSPFKALPLFGDALLGIGASSVSRQVAGIAFHVLNGAAFGVAYTVWFGERGKLWGVGFALGLEAFMLALYPGWLDIRSIGEFTQISLLGHIAYGAALGWSARALLSRARA